jgi:acetylornithine/N-succinyldiaminopimelate aminotransferase
MNYYDRSLDALMHAYGRYDVTFDHGDGIHLYDVNQKEYIDFFSGIGVNSFGYNYPAYVEAMEKQLHRLMHISNYFNTVETIEAAECVKKATKLDKVFFTNSGAESTEGALKLARKYYYQKHGKADSEIISLNHSFHGRTTGSVKLTGNAHYQEAFGPLIEGVKYAEINDLDSVKALLNEKTAAIIVEPVQGEGGVYVCSKEFLTGLRKLCDERDIALILDEVQCGMGRTGTIMTYFQYDILPDILCLAKGIGAGFPMGAFVANKKFAAAMEPGDHGSTYGGNPMAGQACRTVFKILEDTKMIDRVQDISEYLIEKLVSIPHIDILNLESESGIVAFNVNDIFSQDVAYYLNKYNICVRAGNHCAKLTKNVTGVDNSLRISLYFYNTEKEIDELVELLRDKEKIVREMI